MDPRRKAALDAEYAKKLAARRDGSAKLQTYPANRGASGRISEIDARYREKLEARVQAFLKPKEEPKPAPVASAKDEDAALEAATRPDPKPKGSGRG